MVAVAAFSSSAFAGEYQLTTELKYLPKVIAECHSDSAEGKMAGFPFYPYDEDYDPMPQPAGSSQQFKSVPKDVAYIWVEGYKDEAPKPFTLTQNCVYEVEATASVSNPSSARAGAYADLAPKPANFGNQITVLADAQHGRFNTTGNFQLFFDHPLGVQSAAKVGMIKITVEAKTNTWGWATPGQTGASSSLMALNTRDLTFNLTP